MVLATNHPNNPAMSKDDMMEPDWPSRNNLLHAQTGAGVTDHPGHVLSKVLVLHTG